MDKQEAKLLLFDIIDILEKYQIKYSLSFGTLLGAIREKNFIEDDNDVDIDIFEPFWKNDILFQKITWDLLEKDIKIHNLCYEVMNLTRKEIHLDVHYYYKKDNFYICDGGNWKFKIPEKYFNKLNILEFLGKKCYIPNNVEEFLLEFYGDTWKEKISHGDTKWGFIDCPGGIIKTVYYTSYLYIYKNIIENEKL